MLNARFMLLFGTTFYSSFLLFWLVMTGVAFSQGSYDLVLGFTMGLVPLVLVEVIFLNLTKEELNK